jgi:hypothetical protein
MPAAPLGIVGVAHPHDKTVGVRPLIADEAVRLKNLGCPPDRLFSDLVDGVFAGSANLRVDGASWSW